MRRVNGNTGDRRKRKHDLQALVDSRDKRPSRRKGSLSDVAGHQTHAPAPHFYGRLVGVDAINGAADEIRQNFFGYRNFVVGEIQEMQNVALCRWAAGFPAKLSNTAAPICLKNETDL